MSNYQKIKIENFGPIISTGEKPLDIKRCTVFIGDQGTGKSTIVKLFSTLTWLEKAIVAKKAFEDKKLNITEIKKLFSQQNIPETYLTNETLIKYESDIIDIKIKNNQLHISVHEYQNKEYICPKIQYVPSERNLLSIAEKLTNVSGLPEMIVLFNSEFNNSKQEIGKIKFQNFSFSYDKKSDTNYVMTKGTKSKVKLKQASSGIQSIFPLLFVSKYISNLLKQNVYKRIKMTDPTRRQFLIESIDNNNDQSIINNYISSGIEINLDKIDIYSYEDIIKRIVNSCFIEIVEEPEQNLFPISQVEVLKSIVEDTNGENDKLIMTTHSPYILSQINNYIFAKSQNDLKNVSIKEIPSSLYVDYNDVSAYKIVDGYVNDIMDKEYGGIDVNEIDECSRNITKVFDKLFT